MAKRAIPLGNFSLVGIQHYNVDLGTNPKLTLSLEPFNPVDPLAIRVLTENKEVVGYLPTQLTKEGSTDSRLLLIYRMLQARINIIGSCSGYGSYSALITLYIQPD